MIDRNNTTFKKGRQTRVVLFESLRINFPKFYVEQRVLTFFGYRWKDVKEVHNEDDLTLATRFSSLAFKTLEEAEEFIKNQNTSLKRYTVVQNYVKQIK